MNGDALIYDVAVSFAGAQRDEVEPLVRACQQLGVKVFYDKDKTVEFWGEHFHYGMRDIYGGAHARYFMPFLSKEYLASPYPMDEFHAGALHALEIMGGTYILPIMVGEVQVPSRLLSPSIGYLMLENYTTEQLAAIIAKKVGVAAAAKPLRLPRLPTTDFSPRKELQAALTRVGGLFQQYAGSLTPYGVQCTVMVSDGLDVRIERDGRLIHELRMNFNLYLGERLVAVSSSPPTVMQVRAEWDLDTRRPVLRYAKFDSQNPDEIVTADELFHLLWDKIVDQLEQS